MNNKCVVYEYYILGLYGGLMDFLLTDVDVEENLSIFEDFMGAGVIACTIFRMHLDVLLMLCIYFNPRQISFATIKLILS